MSKAGMFAGDLHSRALPPDGSITEKPSGFIRWAYSTGFGADYLFDTDITETDPGVGYVKWNLPAAPAYVAQKGGFYQGQYQFVDLSGTKDHPHPLAGITTDALTMFVAFQFGWMDPNQAGLGSFDIFDLGMGAFYFAQRPASFNQHYFGFYGNHQLDAFNYTQLIQGTWEFGPPDFENVDSGHWVGMIFSANRITPVAKLRFVNFSTGYTAVQDKVWADTSLPFRTLAQAALNGHSTSRWAIGNILSNGWPGFQRPYAVVGVHNKYIDLSDTGDWDSIFAQDGVANMGPQGSNIWGEPMLIFAPNGEPASNEGTQDTGQPDGVGIWRSATGVVTPGLPVLNSDPNGITEIYISETAQDSVDLSTGLAQLMTGEQIFLTDNSTAIVYEFTISGPPVDHGTWWTLPVTYVGQSGGAGFPAQDAPIWVAKGESGSEGGF